MPVNKDFYTLAGSSGQSTGYTIDQSIRFARASNTSGTYMQRDFGSAGDRTSWTWSCWFKLGSLNNMTPASNIYYQFFACDNATNDANRGSFHIIADSGVASAIAFQFQAHGTSFMRTNREFRDSSAWYHLVLVWDSDNAVANDRARLYINGTRETDFAAFSNPSAGQEIGINLGEIHRLGISWNISGSAVNYPFDGYMADIHFLDGYSYGPEYFGEFDSNDIWIPKEYDGSYGSNGFFIDGRDSSDLGDDESGNGNDFSTTNFAAHDQALDTPTNSFCTFQPNMSNNSSFEFTEANLKIDMNTNKSWYHGVGTTMSMSSGKWYWESYWNSGDIYSIWGILDTAELYALTGYQSSTTIYDFNFNGIQPNTSGTNDQYRQGASVVATNQAGAPGGIWQFALDMDNRKMWLGYNGTYAGSGNPGAGSNEMWNSTYIASDSYTPVNMGYQISGHTILTYNFGQEGTFAGATTAGGNSDGNGIGNFKYSVPSGFLALCTLNLGS